MRSIHACLCVIIFILSVYTDYLGTRIRHNIFGDVTILLTNCLRPIIRGLIMLILQRVSGNIFRGDDGRLHF